MQRAIVAVDSKYRIAINGDFTVPQRSSSKFYVAYADGVPCVLKFPPSMRVAQQEEEVYTAALKSDPVNAQHLVKVEYMRFDSQLKATRHIGEALTVVKSLAKPS